ncbi:CBS domain-containing protein [Rhodohalobacter sulfatireducens]|uniref:Glutamate-cysteine ligase family protein n=1 Tax=Rhodohalobacter sulfatireducens TaxID=2911366 RepID=A0ABS9KAX2_9BACT|nr:CBS domain-containing protein [Rhodohalobacter sulfatireducens]MCG2588002.1 glutamate-cysteine ligase family protein [Rhodohalobacter sulfatireducens]
MGVETVKLAENREQTQEFIKYLLKDIRAMERMLESNLFEKDTVRIGAEQELCLVDKYGKPLPISMELLEALDDENFTTELAKFNLETNLAPLNFEGNCLSKMEENILRQLDKVRDTIRQFDGDIVLTGVLPTIRKSDLDIENLTPLPRYKALCAAINKLRGDEYDLRIQGMDELLMRFDTPLLEACNTGFQVHIQVTPDEFVQKYNLAQAITGPVLASAVNSPLLFGKRLWSETRVALFHQSVDTRKVGDHLRESSPRVTFGNEWLKDSILEIYKEDIARYRVMLSSNITEDVDELLDNGEIPKLMALQVHNGTVYRWNRPCYGISNGIPHLRIENRIFPSGPTVSDEIANASFWLGLLNGMDEEYQDITKKLDFDDARMNFFAASKLGLDTKFKWVDDKRYSAVDLITKELLPLAKKGLEKAGVDDGDATSYLDIIKERTDAAQTGSYWMVKSYNSLTKDISREQALSAVVNAMIKNQKKGEPAHKWGLAKLDDMEMWQPSSLLVEEFMTTDLFTVQKDDIIELVANLFEWRRIRYVPVEDDSKHLVGLITMRMVFREFNDIIHNKGDTSKSVEKIMIKNPITIHPEASILEAIDIMDSQRIGCLPVVKNNRLVGIITEQNYMIITSRLLRRLHSDEDKNKTDSEKLSNE